LTGSIEAEPLLLPNGRVAVASVAGDVAVIDGITGLSQGRARMFSGPGADLGASDTSFYVASSDQSLYAYTNDACLPIWPKRTEPPLTPNPTFYNNSLYCDLGPATVSPGSEPSGGGLTCMDPTGKILWSNPGVSGDVIATHGKRLIVWNPATGIAAALDQSN